MLNPRIQRDTSRFQRPEGCELHVDLPAAVQVGGGASSQPQSIPTPPQSARARPLNSPPTPGSTGSPRKSPSFGSAPSNSPPAFSPTRFASPWLPVRPTNNKALDELQRLQLAPHEQVDGRKIENIFAHEKNTATPRLNRDVRPDVFEFRDAAHRNAMERKASFLEIKDILIDIDDSLQGPGNGARTYPERLLLTAQASALKKQVEIGTVDMFNKVRDGRRVETLMLRPKFHDFLRTQTQLMGYIAYACQLAGPARRAELNRHLTAFCHNYLASAGRLPTGLAENEHFTISSSTVEEENQTFYGNVPFVLAVLTADSDGTSLENFNGRTYGFILLGADNTDNPYFNPSHGSDNERYFSAGFEHCDLPRQQAACYIMKACYQLADLEETVAVAQGLNSINVAQNSVASHAFNDLNYDGSVSLADQFDETLENKIFDQRAPIITNGGKRLRDAAVHYRNTKETDLFTEPDINGWIMSPDFSANMDAIHLPQARGWNLNADFARRALLATDFFSATPARENSLASAFKRRLNFTNRFLG